MNEDDIYDWDKFGDSTNIFLSMLKIYSKPEVEY